MPGPDISKDGIPRLSPLAIRLLRTNTPLSSLEETEIRSCLDSERAKLSDIDNKIQQLQRAIDQFNDHRHDIETVVKSYCAVLSPMRRFPAEVLGEILLHHGNEICVEKRGKGSLREAPWVYTYVSRQWRSVALSLPGLWTRIKASSRTASLDILQATLERSRNLPLQLSLTISDGNQPRQHISRVLRGVMAASTRWQDVDLSVSPSMLYRLDVLKDSLPILRSLSLSLAHDNSLGPTTLQGSWLGNAPKLREMTISGYWSLASTKEFHAPWPQLSTFTYDAHYRHPLSLEIDLLRATSGLTSYEMPGRREDDFQEDQAPIPLESLQQLSISIPDASMYVAGLIRAPNLQKLSLMIDSHDIDDECAPLSQIVQLAGRHLAEMHVEVISHYQAFGYGDNWGQIFLLWKEWMAPQELSITVPPRRMHGLVKLLEPLSYLDEKTNHPIVGILASLVSLRLTVKHDGYYDDNDGDDSNQEADEELAEQLCDFLTLNLLPTRRHLLSTFGVTFAKIEDPFAEVISRTFNAQLLEDLKWQHPNMDIEINIPCRPDSESEASSFSESD